MKVREWKVNNEGKQFNKLNYFLLVFVNSNCVAKHIGRILWYVVKENTLLMTSLSSL